MQFLDRVTWPQYVDTITSGDTQKEVARKIQVSASTVCRWANTPPSPRDAVALARAYNHPPLEALIVAGYVTSEEAKAQVTYTVIEREPISSEELLLTLGERLGIDLPRYLAKIKAQDSYGEGYIAEG